jgi:hypothetical protein
MGKFIIYNLKMTNLFNSIIFNVLILNGDLVSGCVRLATHLLEDVPLAVRVTVEASAVRNN